MIKSTVFRIEKGWKRTRYKYRIIYLSGIVLGYSIFVLPCVTQFICFDSQWICLTNLFQVWRVSVNVPNEQSTIQSSAFTELDNLLSVPVNAIRQVDFWFYTYMHILLAHTFKHSSCATSVFAPDNMRNSILIQLVIN